MKQITLKNIEIVNALNTLNSDTGLLKSTDKKFPVSLLFIISKNVKTLEALRSSIVDLEQSINDQYFNDEKSETNEDGLMEVKPEFRDEFIAKKNELFNVENEIQIDMIDINSIASLDMSPADFQSISFMISDEE